MNDLNDDYLGEILEKTKCAEILANQVHTLFFSAQMIAGLMPPHGHKNDCSALTGAGLHICQPEPQSISSLAAKIRNSINSLDAEIIVFAPTAERLLLEIELHLSSIDSTEKAHVLSDLYSGLSHRLAVLKAFAISS